MNKEDIMKGYFTKDLIDSVNGMSDKDMKDYLKSLEGTPTWLAILKYAMDRGNVVKDSLLSLDPLKDASKISQYQGIASGVWDMIDAVLVMKSDSRAKENPKYKEEKTKEDNGGAYGAY